MRDLSPEDWDIVHPVSPRKMLSVIAICFVVAVIVLKVAI